jgi:D-lactate dehydrogenase
VSEADVAFYEAFEEEEAAIRKYLPQNIEALFTWKTIQEYDASRPAARIVSIRTQSLLPTGWADKLAAILSRSTGYDHIIEYRKRGGTSVHCGYLPLYCNRAVAEQAMLLWMSCLRKLRQQMSNFATFHRDGLTGLECQGKRLAVVGVGNIGYEVVRIGRGLGMDVVGVDIVEKYDDVTYTSIEDALGGADIIVCVMNLTASNGGYFNYARLVHAKARAIFINIARGEFSPCVDLLRLLDEGRLGGVGLDVYDQEGFLAVGLRKGSLEQSREVKAVLEMQQRNNVVLTPHNAFNTAEAVERKARHSVQQIEEFLAKGSFLWPVPEE